MDSLLQSVEHKAGMRSSADPPAHSITGIDVDDEGHVDESRPGRDIEPALAEAGVKSETQSMFGADAWNCQLT